MTLKKSAKITNEYVQGITDEEVLVANSASVSGGFAHTGDAINAGVKAYFDMVNSQGGIDKRKIRFIHIDDEYNSEKAKDAFEKLANDEKVFAYVGHFGSSIVRETLDDMRAKGIPVVYFATGIGELYIEGAKTFEEGANCYPIQPLYITEGQEMVNRIVEDFKYSKIGVIYTDDDTGLDIVKGVKIQSEKLKIECSFFMAEKDEKGLYDAVSRLKESDIDFVIVASAQERCAEIVKALAKVGMDKSAITSYLNTTVTISREISAVIDGKFSLYAQSWLWYDGENAINLEKASEWLGDYAINAYAHCGWIGAHFFCEGLRRLEGKKITWQSFMEAMESRPIKIPFGGIVDYSRGKRKGVSDFYLIKADKNNYMGWTPV